MSQASESSGQSPWGEALPSILASIRRRTEENAAAQEPSQGDSAAAEEGASKEGGDGVEDSGEDGGERPLFSRICDMAVSSTYQGC